MVCIHLRRLISAILVCALIFSISASQAQQINDKVTLFSNIRVFDSKGTSLSEPTNVLVRGNLIEIISRAPIPVDRSATTTMIDGGGRTLMPGLIDMHWHAMLIRANPAQAIVGDVGYNNIVAGVEATDTLMRGFTTVRD